MIEYPCAECGSDGPHSETDRVAECFVLECVACFAEIVVPRDPYTGEIEGRP